MLRSFRFGEADRVLHLYTAERGRVGAIAKGVRKTKSRFGARLEPFSHVELLLHQGSGELHTVTGASLVDAHRPAREDSYRLSVGLVGAEAMLRLFVEEERNERAFEALTRFLVRGGRDPGRGARAGGARSARARVPAQAALALRLRSAPRELRRVRRSRRARRLPAASRRRGMLAVCARRDGVALARGLPRHPRAPLERRSPRRTGSGSASVRCGTRSRSSSRRTSSTAASACARSPHEARSRRRLRARRRPGADRPRRGASRT